MPNANVETLECPLCKSESLQYELIEDETHAWICQECPAVLMEFYNDTNSAQLHNRLSVGKSE